MQSTIQYMLDEERAVIDHPTHFDPQTKEKYAKPSNGIFWYVLTYSSNAEKWIGISITDQAIISRLTPLKEIA